MWVVEGRKMRSGIERSLDTRYRVPGMERLVVERMSDGVPFTCKYVGSCSRSSV